MKKPVNFTLTKVKLINGGGLEVSYREKKIDNGITDTIDWNTKSSENPSPDLVNKVAELKEYLAKCYNMDAILTLSKSKGIPKVEKEAFKIVNKVINGVYNETMKKLNVTGVSICGEVDGAKYKRSVVITATQLQENKSKTALNSPRIKLNQNVFKFEGDIQTIVNELADEVEEYLFHGKRAQLDLFEEPKEEVPTLSQDFIDGNEEEKEKAA